MAKGIYVGVSKEEELIKFTSCPYSSTAGMWVNNGDNYSAKNKYGEWLVSAVGGYSNNYPPYYAFDPSTDDGWGLTGTSGTLTLEFPKGVLIKPTKIHLSGRDGKANFEVVGVKEDGSAIQLLSYTHPQTTIDQNANYSQDYDVTIDEYFVALKLIHDNPSNNIAYVKEVFVNEGTLKIAEYSNMARKVTKAYVGVDDKARKIKKGYIGVNNIARLFYSSERLVPFTSSVVPTTWTDSSDYLSATASNDYGEWSVEATSISSAASSNRASYAFDAQRGNTYITGKLGTDSQECYLYINLPESLTIKPSSILVEHSRCGNSTYSSYVQGYDGESWSNLGVLTRANGKYTNTFTISSEKYYKQFRLLLTRYNSTTNYATVYNFEITSGTLKIE